MSDKNSNPLEDAGLHRPLSPGERSRIHALLAANPTSLDSWTAELNLSRLLRELPEKPVSSNFTHCVLEAANRTAPSASPLSWMGWLRRFQAMPRVKFAPALALATLLLGTSFLFYRQHQVQVRFQVANSIARVSDIAAILDPEVLQNFDVISRLDQIPSQVDDELLLALK